jgi:hypothetical protein
VLPKTLKGSGTAGAERRYEESAKSKDTAENHSLAGDEYKSELEELLNSFNRSSPE